MRKRHRIVLVLLGIFAAHFATAQSTQLTVRYHFGDVPGWASPAFDDSSWPIAQDGRWPLPPFYSSGVVWVRIQVPVAPDAGSSPALRLLHPGENYGSEQVFLDGVPLSRIGYFPPRPQAMMLPSSGVFPAPVSVDRANIAILALRLWYQPYLRYQGGLDQMSPVLESATLAGALERGDQAAAILSWTPMFAFNGLLGLAGIALFVFWFRFRRRELLWFSLVLFFYSVDAMHSPLIAFASHPISASVSSVLGIFFNVVTMSTTVEFLWIVFRFRARWLRALLHIAWIVFNAAALFGFATVPSPALPWSLSASVVALTVFNVGTLLIDLRFLIFGPNRGIALGMALIPIGSSLWIFKIQDDNLFGIPHLNLFDAGFLLAGFFIAVTLVRRALADSRKSNELRVEFEAAREVQQQLVTRPPEVPGFRIESVYAPAKQVGGDFFRVLPEPDGGVLVIVGDVSGKGLRAAMTVSAIIGALSTLSGDSPAQLLNALNRALAGNLRGGFVTCLVARIDLDGALTLANAGHLSPYRNGEEVPVDNGLPLGIAAGAEYSEATLQLQPGNRLTFLSDGVVEAQSADGELFGFERTQAISTESAEAIAHAAQVHGQQDDITVLTLTFAPAEVLHA
ncbi:MAG TPA: PP2C family protein-serine/threonine phosphatase [Terracidiphilus sp.]|nr:PP2C family protein-serine/threonine phosphatase [Terracidiphilus sp.]